MRSFLSTGPFEGHLREAIALNRYRAPLYAELSGGDTRSLSDLLIGAERLLLPVARWFDGRAERYHRAGVPLLEDLFVSMTHAPAFGSMQLSGEAAADAVWLRAGSVRMRVRAAFGAQSFEGAAAAIATELQVPDATRHGNDMVRHLLESAERLASLAPGHLASSAELGLPSPERLLTRLFRMHLWGLTAASALDRRARPFHARGIPILAQDLPQVRLHQPDAPSQATLATPPTPLELRDW